MLRCHGECDTEGCEYETNDPLSFGIHTNPETRERRNAKGRKRVNCDICGKELNQSSLKRHKKRKHDFQPRTCLRCPPEFDHNKFAFVKKLVEHAIEYDMKNVCDWTEKDQQDLRDIDNNEARQALAIDVFNRFKELDGTDDHGGQVTEKCKLVLYPHSLFSFSLDWINHSRPHFADKNLNNLKFSCKGMNVNSALHKWAAPRNTPLCDQLCAEMQREISEEMVQKALEREKNPTSRALGKRKRKGLYKNVLYDSVSRIYDSDPTARAAFGSRAKMFKYIYELYRAAGGRCAVSTIFMSGHAHNQLDNTPNCPHPFQSSVDAIDPAKGHVPGNLRVVCAFLNPRDNSKQDKYKALKAGLHGEIPHSWNTELWFYYVGFLRMYMM